MKFEIEGELPQERRFLTDSEYDFVFQRAVRFCLDFLIVKDKEFMLMQRTKERQKGIWSLVGGMMRYKETFDQATERLLTEEINCKPNKEKIWLLGAIQFMDEGKFHSVSNVLVVTLKDMINFKLSDQGLAVKFFSSLPMANLHPEHGVFLKEHWPTIQAMLK